KDRPQRAARASARATLRRRAAAGGRRTRPDQSTQAVAGRRTDRRSGPIRGGKPRGVAWQIKPGRRRDVDRRHSRARFGETHEPSAGVERWTADRQPCVTWMRTPMTSQAPSLKFKAQDELHHPGSVMTFLELGNWLFSGALSLEFGASRTDVMTA